VLEYDCLREDGQPVIVRGEGFDLDYHGEPARVTMLTPIAREGVTADRLHQASAFFRLAFEHAPIGKALVSPEGRILAVNRVLSELVGVAAEPLLGRPYNVLAHPDDPDIGPEHAARLLNGESSGYRIERRYVHAQGHVIRVQISVSLVRTLDGQPRYFVAQLEDITQRRAAEAALQRETARLRLLQTVAEAANVAEEPEVAYATAVRAVCEHTGWPLGHVNLGPRGRDSFAASDIWCVDDDARPRFDDFMSRTTSTVLVAGAGLAGRAEVFGRPVWLPTTQLTPTRRAAAEAAGIRSSIALPVPAGDTIVAVLEFFSDSAEPPDAPLMELLRHVGTQLGRVAERERARAAAAALDEARDRFVANAAHELRTPLATLRTVAGLLGSRRAQMSEADIEECCELLERQGANLDALVGDLLDLSRIQRAGDDTTTEVVDVEMWVARALETARPPDGVRVSCRIEEGLFVHGHADRLNRALVNLLANAYRHGGPSVGVRAHHDGSDVVVLVEDDGDGVPEHLLTELFEPFTRHEAGQGAGLGLAITRALVEQAGGSVAYQGATDQGARFMVRLPGAR
jgi:PAS domain S-box-containing protein